MKQVLAYAEQHKQRFLGELKELIAIPSVSTKPEHKKDVVHCAQWLGDHLAALGMAQTKIFPTAGNPIVYAEWKDSADKPAVLLYGHYDVQPPEPLELWHSPPFEATIRGKNMYGRGTTDDKGQFFIHLKTLEAYLKTAGGLPVHVKLILEGEEEIGSEHLKGFVEAHREMLKADLVAISDTPFFAAGVPSICYGLRGITYMQIDLEGPNRDLHSGSYGGAVHNPIQALAEIIARLHDRSGKIAIPGFYDDVRPLTRFERSAYGKLPWNDRQYAAELGLKQLYGEKGYTTLERLWARPTLECNGIWGGYTGEGTKTVIPARASAKISMRLVPDQKQEKIARGFEQHIKRLAPKSVHVKVTCLHHSEPFVSELDAAGIQAAAVALEKGFGKKPLYQREGGSIPIVTQFKKTLGADTVMLGFGLPDENAHAPNEFISLDNFFGGIKTVAHFYNELQRHLRQGA